MNARAVLAPAALALWGIACGSIVDSCGCDPIIPLEVEPAAVTVAVGDSVLLTASPGYEPDWISDDATVATVRPPRGHTTWVRGVAEGTTVIVAWTLASQLDSVSVTVTP